MTPKIMEKQDTLQKEHVKKLYKVKNTKIRIILYILKPARIILFRHILGYVGFHMLFESVFFWLHVGCDDHIYIFFKSPCNNNKKIVLFINKAAAY